MRTIQFLLSALVVLMFAAGGQAWAVTITTFTSEAAFDSAVGAGLTVINFDNDPAGNPIPSGTIFDLQYASLGVDFNPFNGGTPEAITEIPTLLAVSTPNVLTTVGDLGTGGGGFEAVLTPTAAVGLFFGDLQFPGNTFAIFDAGGASLGSFDVISETGGGAQTFLFFGVTSDVPIGKLQVSVPLNDAVAFDNLKFASVPEPSTWILFSTGALGLIGYAWRCRRGVME